MPLSKPAERIAQFCAPSASLAWLAEGGEEPFGWLTDSRPCMTKPVYVLGTGLSHSGLAVLLKDGCVSQGGEKERITRRKRDGGNDTHAVWYGLDTEGITLNGLDLVVQSANISMPDASSYGDVPLFGGNSKRFISKDSPQHVFQ